MLVIVWSIYKIVQSLLNLQIIVDNVTSILKLLHHIIQIMSVFNKFSKIFAQLNNNSTDYTYSQSIV